MDKKTLKVVDRISKKYGLNYTYKNTDKLNSKEERKNLCFFNVRNKEIFIWNRKINIVFSYPEGEIWKQIQEYYN